MSPSHAALLETIGSLTAPLEERLRAGTALAAMGDPRVAARETVAVAEGPFLSGPADRLVEVSLPAFSIDRFPVTVGAFAEFLEAGGYEEPRHWSSEGWAWRRREGIERPRFWDDPAWAPYLVPNHPVVGASFHEAEAYARFRDARLPTALEWEKACRGSDGRAYPWGDAWIEDACGVRGVGPRGTCPIGSFPRGVGPWGLFDMVGCVWHWCTDAYEGPSLEHDVRVTRGGGWNNLPRFISCTSQNGYPAHAQFSNLGFRCAGPLLR